MNSETAGGPVNPPFDANIYTRVPHSSDAPHPHLHLNPRAQPVQHRDQAVHREAAKVSIADAAEVGCGDTSAGMRRAHGQAFPIECLDNLGGQDGLELLRVRHV